MVTSEKPREPVPVWDTEQEADVWGGCIHRAPLHHVLPGPQATLTPTLRLGPCLACPRARKRRPKQILRLSENTQLANPGRKQTSDSTGEGIK